MEIRLSHVHGCPSLRRLLFCSQEFLLDTFMNGFIYKMYLNKWNLYGRRIHYAKRSLDGLLTISLAVQVPPASKNTSTQPTPWLSP